MGNVKLDDVRKSYGEVVAVDGMNIDIEDGEFITLVGPSGCGKSTTLETVAGLTLPTSGTISIADRDVTDLPPKDRGIAMVFQNIALFPHMDVYDNISFGLRLRDFDDDEIDRRVDRASNIVQLEGMEDRMPDELSGGQRQRVAIARAIVREPDVFLMDEPLANLDAKLRVHMRTELQRLHKKLDTTIIYVTHDQEEAMTMSDRVAVINDGQLQQIAPPLECYNEPANRFVAGFIGSPSMNFVDGEVTETAFATESFDIELDPSALDGVEPGDQLTLGVRPEDVYLERNAASVDSPSETITTTTDVLEPMGDEIFVYLTLGDSADGDGALEGDRRSIDDQLLMSVNPDADIEANKTVKTVLDRSRIHLFDAATGEAVTHDVTEVTSTVDAGVQNAGGGN